MCTEMSTEIYAFCLTRQKCMEHCDTRLYIDRIKRMRVNEDTIKAVCETGSSRKREETMW